MAQQHLRKLLSTLLPTGMLGVSVALAPPAQALPFPKPETAAEPSAASIAARLQSIREAVSTVTAETADTGGGDPNILKTWWRNGGWGNGGWGRGWGNGGFGPVWGNGGWGNGGWHNGGWGNWHGWRRW